MCAHVSAAGMAPSATSPSCASVPWKPSAPMPQCTTLMRLLLRWRLLMQGWATPRVRLAASLWAVRLCVWASGLLAALPCAAALKPGHIRAAVETAELPHVQHALSSATVSARYMRCPLQASPPSWPPASNRCASSCARCSSRSMPATKPWRRAGRASGGGWSGRRAGGRRGSGDGAAGRVAGAAGRAAGRAVRSRARQAAAAWS